MELFLEDPLVDAGATAAALRVVLGPAAAGFVPRADAAPDEAVAGLAVTGSAKSSQNCKWYSSAQWFSSTLVQRQTLRFSDRAIITVVWGPNSQSSRLRTAPQLRRFAPESSRTT